MGISISMVAIHNECLQPQFYYTNNFFVDIQAIDYPYQFTVCPEHYDVPRILFYNGHIMSISRLGFFNHSETWSELEIVGDDPTKTPAIDCDLLSDPYSLFFPVLIHDTSDSDNDLIAFVREMKCNPANGNLEPEFEVDFRILRKYGQNKIYWEKVSTSDTTLPEGQGNHFTKFWRLRPIAPMNSEDVARFWPTLIGFTSDDRVLTVQYEDWLVKNNTVTRMSQTVSLDSDMIGLNLNESGIVRMFF